MLAEIISIGNELLNGNTVNSNATYISKKLHENGIITGYIQVVGDVTIAIRQALDLALARSDVILLTGGLGPTPDDITRNVVADYFGHKLIFDEQIYDNLKKRFARRGIPIPEVNRNQAMVPEGVELIPNRKGSAQGMIFRRKQESVFVMPGVPMEMKGMMENTVIPKLREMCPDCRVKVDFIRSTGLAESVIYQKMDSELNQFTSYEIAFLPNFSGVDLRVVRKGEDITDNQKFKKFLKLLDDEIGDAIYAREDIELEEVLGKLLRERKLTISLAESLTGGLVQHKLTQIPGSSDYFMGGIVSYSNEAKMELLGVRESSLKKYGAVSELVAKEMAEGVRKRLGADIGISTTGIAGPTGATATKPVGLVYLALSAKDIVIARKQVFGPDRNSVKQRSAQAALELARRYLLGLPIN
jgi:nicotinamide-nucleotide amidase